MHNQQRLQDGEEPRMLQEMEESCRVLGSDVGLGEDSRTYSTVIEGMEEGPSRLSGCRGKSTSL